MVEANRESHFHLLFDTAHYHESGLSSGWLAGCTGDADAARRDPPVEIGPADNRRNHTASADRNVSPSNRDGAVESRYRAAGQRALNMQSGTGSATNVDDPNRTGRGSTAELAEPGQSKGCRRSARLP